MRFTSDLIMPVCHLYCLSAMHIPSQRLKGRARHGLGVAPTSSKAPLWVNQWLVGRVEKRHPDSKREIVKT